MDVCLSSIRQLRRLANKAALDNFEPQFIKDIQSAIKAKAKSYIGKMHMITIK